VDALADLIANDVSLACVRLDGARLEKARLDGAELRKDLLSTADLRDADLHGAQGWESITSLTYTNIQGVRNPPTGFREWALERGAIDGDNPLERQTAQSFSTEWRAV
jgi:hypothetical protein